MARAVPCAMALDILWCSGTPCAINNYVPIVLFSKQITDKAIF